MTLLVDTDTIRNRNKELLYTDGIDSDIIDSNTLNAQIRVFAAVAHLYDIDEITADNLPAELQLAITDMSAGQTIIDEYPKDKDIVEIGKSYKADADTLLKNIVSGKRRFSELTKTDTQNTITRSIVSKKSTIDTNVDTFIDSIKYWNID